MITYFLKSFVCLALLLAFYHLVLEREKMHQFNRFYLLGSIVFSFIAPLYKIYKEATQTIVEVMQPVVLDNSPMIEITEPIKEVNYLQYVYILYFIVSLILTIRFIKNLLAIYLKTKQHEKIKKGKATLVLVNDLISPHTFWNYIFINKEEYYSNKIETELYTHEITHAFQKHTFDILLIEVLQIVFWINPTYILLKKAIKLNHEFLADSNVIIKHKNTSEYQYLLLNRAAWNNEYYLASNLNYLLTKKRLLMMTKQSSRTKILFKKLAVIPVLAGFTFLFAERVEAENSEIKYIDSEIINKQKNEEALKDIKEKLKNANSLKLSIIKQDTFTSKLPNGEKIKIWEDKVGDYLELHKTYETLRNQKPHYIKSSHKRKELLNNMSSKLGKLYFRLSKTDKQKVRRAKNPKHPYIRLKKDNKVYYKLWNDLSEDERKLLPPPPPAPEYEKKKWKDVKYFTNDTIPSKPKTGFINLKNQKIYYVKNEKGSTYYNRWGQQVTENGQIISKQDKFKKSNTIITGSSTTDKNGQEKGWKHIENQTLYYVKNKKRTTYYNRWGQQVTKEGKVINPEQTSSNKVIPGQNITKVYKDSKVVTEFKRTNLPPPPPKANFPEVKKGQNSNIPPPPTPTPISAKELVFKYPSAIYYYNNKKVSHKKVLTLVKNQKGLSVLTQEKNGKETIRFISKDYEKKSKELQKTVTIDKIDHLTNDEILALPKHNNKEPKYYLEGKLISKEKLTKIDSKKIKSISVKKEKDGSGSLHITLR